MPPSEEERIAAAVAVAVKETKERVELSIELDNIGSKLSGIIESQKDQAETNTATAIAITEIKGCIKNLEKSPRRNGLVSGGAAGVGGAGIGYGLIELVRALTG